MNKREKSAARKRAFRSEQSEEEKQQATEQARARTAALRNQQSHEEKKYLSSTVGI